MDIEVWKTLEFFNDGVTTIYAIDAHTPQNISRVEGVWSISQT